MATYVMRVEDSYYITKHPVEEEGDGEWIPWLNRGVYMEGIRRIQAKGFEVFSFVLPDNQEITKAYYMISYHPSMTDLIDVDILLRSTGLERISRLEYVDEEEDKFTLIFYLLP